MAHLQSSPPSAERSLDSKYPKLQSLGQERGQEVGKQRSLLQCWQGGPSQRIVWVLVCRLFAVWWQLEAPLAQEQCVWPGRDHCQDEAGILDQVDLEYVSFEQHQHLKPDFREGNPLGLVPFFIEGEFNLYESVAIGTYISNAMTSLNW